MPKTKREHVCEATTFVTIKKTKKIQSINANWCGCLIIRISMVKLILCTNNIEIHINIGPPSSENSVSFHHRNFQCLITAISHQE